MSERYKLVACKTKKVAHTNIARVLYTLDNMIVGVDKDDTNITGGGGQERRSVGMSFVGKNKKSAELEFSQYTKFMFVRDPLERLISAYRDQRPGHWFHSGGSKSLSFQAYLLFVLNIPADMTGNRHVASYARMCNPCGVKYDYIGVLDNFDSDMRKILDLVGADKNVVPQRNQFYRKERTRSEIVQTYIKGVPKALIEKFYVKYYWDYFIFGFPKPEF